MDILLDEACSILDDFENEIAYEKAIWDQIAIDNPNFEQVSPESWLEKYYQMWLHGETDIWTLTELGRWLTDSPPATTIAKAPAQEIYVAWREKLLISGPKKTIKITDYDKKSCSYVERELEETSAAFYAEHDKFEIKKPLEGESLYAFIIRLAKSFKDAHDRHQKCRKIQFEIGDWLQERALKSFLGFVRKKYSKEQVAFIEHVLPQKMDIHFGSIIRLIPLEAYPVPEKTARNLDSAFPQMP